MQIDEAAPRPGHPGRRLQFRRDSATFLPMERTMTPLDRFIATVDQALRTAAGEAPPAGRDNPAADLPEPALDPDAHRHVAGLMRINHTGEICAQALYAGQAATARSPEVRAEMAHAADEEIDHLAWCQDQFLWYKVRGGGASYDNRFARSVPAVQLPHRRETTWGDSRGIGKTGP